MSNITILRGSSDGALITMVCHYTTPVGNNAVGIAWTAALANSGLVSASAMTTGTGAGQISTSDAAALIAGTLREVVTSFQILNLSSLTGSQKTAALLAIYNTTVTADQAALQLQLNFFGYTQ